MWSILRELNKLILYTKMCQLDGRIAANIARAGFGDFRLMPSSSISITLATPKGCGESFLDIIRPLGAQGPIETPPMREERCFLLLRRWS